MVYDYDQFSPGHHPCDPQVRGQHLLCAPTVFRYLIRQHITREDFGQVSHITTAGRP